MSDGGYYCVYNHGRRTFYDPNGSRIAFARIPSEFKPFVTIRDPDCYEEVNRRYEKNAQQYRTKQTQADKLRAKLRLLEEQMANLKVEMDNDEEKLKNTKPKQEQRVPEEPPPQHKPSDNPHGIPIVSILYRLQLFQKKQWKKWLLYNHPDKACIHPDIVKLEVYQEVLSEGKRYW